jgi:hypothetical protein
MNRLGLLALICLMGCGGYQFSGEEQRGMATLTIPYIKGDGEGVLNNELVRALSEDGVFEYSQNGGALILDARIIDDGEERIGYRYDRNPTTGSLRDNIVGTENRRSMAVEIQLIDAYTNEVVLGPEVIRASAEYDYVDQNSIRDLTFMAEGKPQTVLGFSLGQLDSVDGAHNDVSLNLYRDVAHKVRERLLLYSIRLASSPSQK